MNITLKQYLAELDRRLNRIRAAVSTGEPGGKLRKRIAANRARQLVFITNRDDVAPRHVPQGDQRILQWAPKPMSRSEPRVSSAKLNRASALDVLSFVAANRSPGPGGQLF